MKHYFLVAKDVGDLTRILCAALEEEQAKPAPGLTGVISRFRRRVRRIPGSSEFVEDQGRIALADPDVFKRDPVSIIRLFHVADLHGLEYHPDALKAITRCLSLIDDSLREDAEANRLFMSILTSRIDPAMTLRRMNEAAFSVAFIPEFGKIVAMMQFSMYHHYTVDEHLIRAVEALSNIDKGLFADEHPLANKLMPHIEEREALYVAVLLHDIAKGRQEDHSIAGARVARKLCPRFGLKPKQTDLVVWLIDQHLLMSMVAQTRDLNDRKTVTDFADTVQSLDRLKMLLILTIADIRAVGPGVWNGWKGQLLRTLYYETELLLSGGFSEVSRKERAKASEEALAHALSDWSQKDRKIYSRLHYQPYLLSVPLEDQVRHVTFIREADRSEKALATMVRTDSFRAITEITVLAPDHPRLLSIIAVLAPLPVLILPMHRSSPPPTAAHWIPFWSAANSRTTRTSFVARATIGRMIEDVLAAASACGGHRHPRQGQEAQQDLYSSSLGDDLQHVVEQVHGSGSRRSRPHRSSCGNHLRAGRSIARYSFGPHHHLWREGDRHLLCH